MAKVKSEIYAFRHPLARRVQTNLGDEPSKTQSEFAKDLDINRIVERHVKAGMPFPVAESQFADVSEVVDFQTAQNTLIRANEAWMSLDAKVRREFNDKPENFLKALHDPSMKDELVRLKVLKKEKPAEAPPVGGTQGANGAAGGTPASQGGSSVAGGGVAPGTVST